MEVKIGVQHAPREIVFETTEDPAEIEKRIAEAVAKDGTFGIDDTRGRRILVPGNRIAYVEIGSSSPGQVGFRS